MLSKQFKMLYLDYMSIFQTFLLTLAISAVAIADVLLKKTESLGSMSKAILSPWMLGAVILYLFQIFFFTYLFISGTKIINIGIMQTVLYAIIILFSGVFIFGESLTTLQCAGVLLALVGVILINF
jgi:drug/metabolite transporter (DMT)-like permease